MKRAIVSHLERRWIENLYDERIFCAYDFTLATVWILRQVERTIDGAIGRICAAVLFCRLILPANVLLAQTDSATSVPTSTSTTDPTTDVLRSTVLQGQLPTSASRHFLGVEPLQRDGVIVLTLSYDPYSDPQMRGLVNFQVLDEDGLRQYLAGGDLDVEEIASGSLVQFDPIGNKMRAAFQDSGRGNYTAVITNDSTTPVTYTLSALGAALIDDAGQTTIPAALTADAASADSDGRRFLADPERTVAGG